MRYFTALLAAIFLLVASPVFAQGTSGQAVIVGPNYISGLGLANDSTTPNTIVDVGTGIALDSTGINISSYVAGTVNFGTTGAGGLDTGSIGASTWYGIFEINGTSGTSAIASAATTWAILGDGASVGATTTGGSTSVTISSSETVTKGQYISIVGAGPQSTTYRGQASASSSGTTVTVSPAPATSVTDKTVTAEGWANGGGPSLPTGYSYYRYIGSVKTDASSHILAFTQFGRHFTLLAAVGESVSGTTSAALVQISVPPAAPTPVLPFGSAGLTAAIVDDNFLIRAINYTNSPQVILTGQVLTQTIRTQFSDTFAAYAGRITYSTSSGSDVPAFGTNGWDDPNVAP